MRSRLPASSGKSISRAIAVPAAPKRRQPAGLGVRPRLAETGAVLAVDAPSLTTAAGGGRALPEALRGGMEAALGADFADVRLHVDRQPLALGADAVTRGSHIHFAPGRLQPGLHAGRALLAHELAHVVQQRSVRGLASRPGHGVALNVDAQQEATADRQGERAARFLSARPAGLPSRGVAAVPPAPVAGGALQAALKLGGSKDYQAAMRKHLQTLAGEHGEVRIDDQGNVSLAAAAAAKGGGGDLKEGDLKAGDKAALPPSHRLLKRIIEHGHTVNLRPNAAKEAPQAEPEGDTGYLQQAAGFTERTLGHVPLVGGLAGKLTGGLFRIGQGGLDYGRDLLSWSGFGTTRKVRNRAQAAKPGGVGSVVPLAAKDLGGGSDPVPDHIVLAHELVHADRFQRGKGASSAKGEALYGFHAFDNQGHVTQKWTPLEESENVGLPQISEADLDKSQSQKKRGLFGDSDRPALLPNKAYVPPGQRAKDDDAITGNDIRAQFKRKKRLTYGM
jgi:hypothetical protein